MDLDKFNSIGWDLDETMIDHSNSGKIQNYIKSHPEKNHYIITFRTHEMVGYIFSDISAYPQKLTQKNFKGVFHIEDAAWSDNEKMKNLRYHQIKHGPLTPEEIYYKTYKGRICHENNIPVLVDDRKNDVILGCEKYGIEYMHPDDLYM